MSKNKPKKQPVFRVQPDTEKKPKSESFNLTPGFPKFKGGHLGWRFSSADKASGPFSWSNLNDAGEYKDVLEKLHQFETMNEHAIVNGGSHTVDVANLCTAAQRRLEELRIDDVDYLMSFRVGAKPRIWCRPNGHIMMVLWWDPNHQVCPSPKKGT
ncbi:hypothetical protein [Inquilinus sp. OTU3971]|uniref:hypothetical protein n=1 Tax=Inquilinus sp. OTU3971 TaxID=3043855 RepID=UPI00313B9D3B